MRIWNANTGKELVVIEAQAQFGEPNWSADGKLIIAPCEGSYETKDFLSLCEWSAQTGELIQLEPADTPDAMPVQDNQIPENVVDNFSLIMPSIEWSPDGTQLASIIDDDLKKAVQLWAVEQGTLLQPTATFAPNIVDRIYWTPDNRTIITFGREDFDSRARIEVRQWGAETGREVKKLFESESQIIRFEPDTAPVIAWNHDFSQYTVTEDKDTIRFSSGESYQVMMSAYEWIQWLQWSPDDQFIIIVYGTGDNYRIDVLERETFEIVTQVIGPDYYVLNTIWRPDSSMFAAASPWINASGEAITVRLYNVPHEDLYVYTPQGIEIRVEDSYYKDGRYTPPGIAWSPNGDLIAVSSTTAINIYEPDAGKLIASIPAYEVISLSWHPDGKVLASSSNDGTIRLWGVRS